MRLIPRSQVGPLILWMPSESFGPPNCRWSLIISRLFWVCPPLLSPLTSDGPLCHPSGLARTFRRLAPQICDLVSPASDISHATLTYGQISSDHTPRYGIQYVKPRWVLASRLDSCLLREEDELMGSAMPIATRNNAGPVLWYRAVVYSVQAPGDWVVRLSEV